MEQIVNVEVRRKAKVGEAWSIVDERCSALIRGNKLYLLLNDDTTRVLSLDDPRAWWLETEKGMFIGAFINTSTYERDDETITTEWEYVVRSI